MSDYLIVDRLIQNYNKVEYNYIISDYYMNMSKDEQDYSYYNRAIYIKQCYKYFNTDIYKQSKLLDLKNISLCHDKFCKNCQNLLSLQRYNKYKPYLDELADKYDLYHVILTVPNVPATELNYTLDKMYSTFQKLVTILRRANTRNLYLQLTNIGYLGGIRALEITYDKNTGYHPHFHCIICLKKELNLIPTTINKYSFNNGQFVRKFTDFEITLQKLWYMLYNNIRITETNYNNVGIGYSCVAELTNYDYKEVFKYTLKESFEYILDSEEVFKTLQSALYNRRILQSYGVLYGLCEDEQTINQDIDKLYYNFLINNTNNELPSNLTLTLKNIEVLNKNQFNLISRKSIKELLKNEE